MSNRKYIAFTLGPIYRTMKDLRKTRAVFAGSYLFSYIMKKMMEEMSRAGVDMNNVLLPSPSGTGQSAPGVGLFPDRLIMVSNADDDFNKVVAAKNKVIEHLSKEIAPAIRKGVNDVMSYFQDYFKIYAIEVELPQNDETINTINKYLNSLELTDNFPVQDNNYLADFLNTTPGVFLIKDAFGKKKKRFESLIEIATVELSRVSDSQGNTETAATYQSIVAKHLQQNGNVETQPDQVIGEDDEESIVKDLKKAFPNEFRAYHKYVAVLNIDGDRFGNHIESLAGEDEKIKQFSENLLKFGLEANKLILDYSGSPVYIGGDDLLLFAPVVSLVTSTNGTQHKQTVFSLIKKLDELFYTFFPIAAGSPSLSCGLSISYYKYPLNEAIQRAEQLMYAAKASNDNKNAVSFEFLKSGGSFLHGTLQKGNNAFFTSILDFIEAISEQDEQLFTSLIQGFSQNKVMMNYLCGTKNKAQNEQNGATLKNWFNNNFNEDIHNKNRAFILDKLIPFIRSIYIELNDEEKAFNLTTSLLKIIKFLRSKDDER
jgi:CRISPR-associated protein Cmr2